MIYIEMIFLVAILIYVATVHVKLNTKNKADILNSPISFTSPKNEELPTNKTTASSKNVSTVKSTESTEIANDNNTEDTNKEVIEYQSISDIVSPSKIIELSEDDKVETTDTSIDNPTLFLITQERLASWDKTEEEQEMMNDKINFQEQQNAFEDEIPLDNQDISVDYSSLLSHENKKRVMNNILETTEFKWYEQLEGGKSIEKITAKDDFVVEQYKF